MSSIKPATDKKLNKKKEAKIQAKAAKVEQKETDARIRKETKPIPFFSCVLSGMFTTALIVWCFIWPLLLFISYDRVTAVLGHYMHLVIVFSIMPIIGILILELRHKISVQPFLHTYQQHAIFIGRMIGAIGTMYMIRMLWFAGDNLEALEKSAADVVAEQVTVVASTVLEGVVETITQGAL